MKLENKFSQKLERFFELINSTNPYFLVLFVIAAHYLSFKPTGNEELYFPLAKQFMNPNWMPHSFIVNEWPGTRILYQLITGFMLKYMTFEQVGFWGRLFIFIVSAYPLTQLFKLFRFSNVAILIIIEIFLIRQSWIGGEYIFENFEPKSFAYIFVLFSLPLLIKGKYMQSIILAGLASYFHILVGGWYAVFALMYTLIYSRNFLQTFKLGVVYTLIVSPFAYYLSLQIFESGSIINGINIDWVYTFYRNPHHTAPLSRPDALTVVWPSIIQMAIFMVWMVFVMRKKRGQYADKLFIMNTVIYTMLWIGLIISTINTSGSILKYYLFRINTVGALLFYIYVFWWFNQYHPKISRKAGYILFFLLFLPSLIGRTSSNIRKNYLKEPNPNYIELINYIKENTDKSDIFIEKTQLPLSFIRMSERESFVSYRMVPGGGKKIYDWYIRVELLKSLRDNINTINQITKSYPINYMISKEKLNHDNLQLSYSNSEYYIYKIN